MTLKTFQLVRNIPNDIIMGVTPPIPIPVKQAISVSGKVLVGASQTTFTTDIQGYGDDYLVNMKLTVVRDSAGGGLAPQGEEQTITSYTSGTGSFTCASFSVTVDADDRVRVTNKTVAADVAGTCDSGMAASRTVIVCLDLAGAGDQFYNGRWLKVTSNLNSKGVAPEGEECIIINYVSISGTFTIAGTGFSANVEQFDLVSAVTHGFKLDDSEAYSQQFITDNKYEVS